MLQTSRQPRQRPFSTVVSFLPCWFALVMCLCLVSASQVLAASYSMTSSSGAAIVPGTNDIGFYADDEVTLIPLPFDYQLYDQTFTAVQVSSNGNLQFTGAAPYTAGCLPDET